MPNWNPATDAELDAQITVAEAHARIAESAEPRALSVRYEEKANRVILDLQNGCTFAFPPDIAQGLAGARPAALSRIEIILGGEALEWPELGVGFTVPGLMAGIFGGKAWMKEHFSENGRKGGSANSEAKRAAARENGKKGGRPRKAAI